MIVKGEAPRRLVWQERTLGEQLRMTAEVHGDRLAIIDGSVRQTWSTVDQRVRRLARGMLGAGLRRGDHIGLFLPNCGDFLVVWLAAARIGAVTVPFNTRYGRFELEHVLADSDVRAVFLADSFLSIDAAGLFAELDPLASGRFPRLEQIHSVTPASHWPTVDVLISRGDSITDDELDAHAGRVSASDTAIIVYTSGSTGVPKGVMHSHHVLRNECAIAEWLAIDETSVILGHMPFFHVAGGLSALLPALLTGASVVFVDHWDASAALDLIQRERVSVFGGIATHYLDVVHHPDLPGYDLASLRTGWMGGAMNPRELIAKIHERLPCRVFPVYGMTETTSVTTYPRWDDPEEVLLSGSGVPISDFELRVVDVGTGEELGVGRPGEVQVRGHCVMQGYYENPEATSAAIDPEGWFHTGDVGRLDDTGHLTIVGRSKDMYIVGGNNVYPAEIEAALAALPSVQLAQVVAVPDERLGEIGFAYIQFGAGPPASGSELTAWARERLAGFKVPRHWMVVTDWPRLDNGKVDRRALQARAIESLDLGEVASRRLLSDVRPGAR